jgi:hypothetical protein
MFLENDNVTLGVCSKELYENRLFPVLSLLDGAQGELRRNIEKCGLTKFCEYPGRGLPDISTNRVRPRILRRAA